MESIPFIDRRSNHLAMRRMDSEGDREEQQFFIGDEDEPKTKTKENGHLGDDDSMEGPDEGDDDDYGVRVPRGDPIMRNTAARMSITSIKDIRNEDEDADADEGVGFVSGGERPSGEGIAAKAGVILVRRFLRAVLVRPFHVLTWF